jgi:hypothetical protein
VYTGTATYTGPGQLQRCPANALGPAEAAGQQPSSPASSHRAGQEEALGSGLVTASGACQRPGRQERSL